MGGLLIVRECGGSLQRFSGLRFYRHVFVITGVGAGCRNWGRYKDRCGDPLKGEDSLILRHQETYLYHQFSSNFRGVRISLWIPSPPRVSSTVLEFQESPLTLPCTAGLSVFLV